MVPTPDNRAVSALFRVFGGAEERGVADAREISPRTGMHTGEFRAFAALIPLTIIVAIEDRLSNSCGAASWLLAVPLGFLALNILPFILAATSQSAQWLLWSGMCAAWAIFHRHAGGIVGTLAYIWLAGAIMNFTAVCVFSWQAIMRLAGKSGIVVRLGFFICLHLAAVVIGYKFGWSFALVAGAGIAALFCRAVLDPYCQWLGPVYCTTDEGKILITLDDGPDPKTTPILLDLLDRYHTKAIFFMIGEKVRAHPELACEVIRRGHEVGNHTMTHPQAGFWAAGPWRTRREIEECQQVIEAATGTLPRWFRAPVGHRNLFTHPVVSDLGLRVMAWNRRGFDAVEKNPKKVLARISPYLSAGDIVLLHEATPIAAVVLGAVLEKASRPAEN